MLNFRRSQKDIILNREFDYEFARRDFRKIENIRFYTFIFTVVLIISTIFAIKANEYKNYDESKLTLNETQKRRFFFLIEQAYSDNDRSEIIARRAEIQRIREQEELELQQSIQEEIIRQQTQLEQSQELTTENQDLVNEIAVISTDFKLAELDEFDDILANFSDAYAEDVKKELKISRAVAATRVSRSREIKARILRTDGKRDGLVNFGEIKEKKPDFFQGFRTKAEIKIINVAMRKNEFLIENCIKKYQMDNPQKRGFFKVQFNIDSIGDIRPESIKITDTDIKSDALLECVIRRIKRFRGFGRASMQNAHDYIFRKKWVLN